MSSKTDIYIVPKDHKVDVCVVRSSSDDDDEQLLLCGSQYARKQPPAELSSKHQLLTLDVLFSATTHQGRLRAIESAHGMLLTTLRSNPTIFDSFKPFMTEKSQASVELLHEEYRCASIKLPPQITSASGALSLRPYQLQGVEFLLKNVSRGVSSILADDMGLGKTAQACAFLNIIGSPGPHLILCPLSTMGGWSRELASWAPTLRVHVYRGKDRCHSQIYRSGVYLVSPATLLNDRGFFLKRAWHCIIVDEAHLLKSSSTSISHIMPRLSAVFRLALTGTLVSNSPAEVWSVMRYLFPRFALKLSVPDESEDWGEMSDACSTVLRHVMLRRTKDLLDLGLPPRLDLPPTLLEPTPFQSILYASLIKNASDLQTQAGLASILINLRRAYCHPLLFRLHPQKLSVAPWSLGCTPRPTEATCGEY